MKFYPDVRAAKPNKRGVWLMRLLPQIMVANGYSAVRFMAPSHRSDLVRWGFTCGGAPFLRIGRRQAQWGNGWALRSGKGSPVYRVGKLYVGQAY